MDGMDYCEECEREHREEVKELMEQLKVKTQKCEKYGQALNEIRNIIISEDVRIRPKLYDFEQDNKILDIINKVKEKE